MENNNPEIILKSTIEIRCERKNGSKFPFWQDLKIGDRIEITANLSSWHIEYKLKNLRNNLEFEQNTWHKLYNQLNQWDYINV